MSAQGTFSFPGIVGIKSGQYLLLHGTQPGIITVTAAYQEFPPAAEGDLVIRYGTVQFSIKKCRIDSVASQATDDGLLNTWTIMDRRWKWRYGDIYGHYNRRVEAEDRRLNKLTAKIVKASEKRPQELAELLLKAMGETRYDVSQLPNDTRPEVEWNGDNPAQELESLCDELGCRVVFDPINDRVFIARAGIGSQLPILPSLANPSIQMNPPDAPSKIGFVAGETRFQVTFKLRAVGVDIDGKLKKVSDLSYTPTGGWVTEAGIEREDGTGDKRYRFPNLSKLSRAKAQETVMRWYQIDVSSFPRTIPTPNGTVVVTRLDQIVNLSLDLNETEKDDLGRDVPKRAFVTGVFCTDLGTKQNSSLSTDNTVYQGRFSLIPEQHIVVFDDPIVRATDNGFDECNFLYVTLTCSLKSRDLGNTFRFLKTLNLNNGADTGKYIIRHDEIVLKVTEKSDPDNTFVTDKWTNNSFADNVDDQARYYLQQASQRFISANGAYGEYNEILRVIPDGAIQSIMWSVSDETGAKTEITRNDEIDIVQRKYRARVLGSQLLKAAAFIRNNSVRKK